MKYHSMIPELTISDIEITKDFYLNKSFTPLEWSNLPLYRITHIAEQFFIKSQNDNLHALRTGLIINKKRLVLY